ncbi:RHS repeat domain-containing protein [Muribaculum intestinale]|uniref:RHS repeat domain-containing protein n=2 Tax=Muribaculum intestinale TaxID=1796646 RepID=UPI00242EAA4B|nr:RHS repeat-associated core domain-containing protein [Muribaculum intestinale]
MREPMNAKATYYLQLAMVLLMSIVANCGYASAIATDCVGVRQRWVREFDRHGRELSVTHYLGDGTPMLLCRRGYDSLGRISEESAGDGASKALVNEYAYDIRSRAVAVSSGRYSQRLDFTPGGNVSRMDWCADASCEPWHSYRFGYDALARVVSAEYSDDDGRRGIYDTTYDYDLNGNVTALSRRGVVSSGIGGEKYGLIDCLAYSYEGNRVVSITDDGQEVYSYGAFHFVDGADEAEEYTYDSNGNITSDLNRGISDISYDVNNRPHRIRFSDGGETRYIYGLDGVKRRAEHVIPGIPPVVSIGAAVSGATVTSTTDYSGAFVYEDGELERIHLDCGYLSYRDFSGSRLAEPEYHFYQRDHLGNNRVDLRSDGLVSQITHYYPFGLPMSMGYSPESQRWKFGNKELDRVNGLDLYDFEARAYDPATIRFYRPDDLAHKYHSISPYVYCLNNPLIKTDSSGKYVESLWDIASMAIGVSSFVDNVSQGNVGAALVDAGGILLDAAATALPGVPGGAGAGIKAYRAGKAATQTSAKVASNGMKNADAIKEGLAFEKEVINQLKESGLEVYDHLRLVPLNGIGNVKGNRTTVDVLVRNEDGKTFTIIEIKLRESTKLSDGQKVAREHVKNGDGIFKIRSSKINDTPLKKQQTIKVTNYIKRTKYDN